MIVGESLAGKLLKKIAMEKGMSGKELANLVGVTPETVSRHMNGRTTMSKKDATKYAEVLSVPASIFTADQQQIPIKGFVDDSHNIKLYDSLNIRTLCGSSYLPEYLVGFEYPLKLESWMRGRIIFVDGNHISNGVISDKIMRNLSICKVLDKDDIRLCVPYPVANYDPNKSDFKQTYYLLNPYIPQANAWERIDPVALDWGTNVIIAMQSPEDLYMEVHKG